jgi:hypothetical protein
MAQQQAAKARAVLFQEAGQAAAFAIGTLSRIRTTRLRKFAGVQLDGVERCVALRPTGGFLMPIAGSHRLLRRWCIGVTSCNVAVWLRGASEACERPEDGKWGEHHMTEFGLKKLCPSITVQFAVSKPDSIGGNARITTNKSRRTWPKSHLTGNWQVSYRFHRIQPHSVRAVPDQRLSRYLIYLSGNCDAVKSDLRLSKILGN